MRLRVLCGQLLGGLVSRRDRGDRSRPPLAGRGAGPVAAVEQPRCQCPRSITYSAYCGHEPTIPYTVTYQCPRCGKLVVEHGFRMAEACYPFAASCLSPAR